MSSFDKFYLKNSYNIITLIDALQWQDQCYLSENPQEWMNELSWFFECSKNVSGKLKVTMGMHMVKYGGSLSGPGTLKSALSQE